MLLGFALIILAGTILLLLPQMTSQGRHTSFLTALFTATSAVCVTGLVVVDTGTHWTLPGQVVIMLLVQIGGLGFMTMAMVFFMVLGKKIGLKNRLLMQESLNHISLQGVVKLVKNIFIFSIVIELLAASILAVRWHSDMSLAKALWFGLFHAVTAFNNAGFDLFGGFKSLTGYVRDPAV
ncbi:MAG: Trk family potassium uptake protein, partial [Peptococcaceae bacterium]|nr:Trk family potassium uptake protein [Peptococcaceae bacterium]